MAKQWYKGIRLHNNKEQNINTHRNQMAIQSITLKGKSHFQNVITQIIPFIWHSGKGKDIGTEDGPVAARGWRREDLFDYSGTDMRECFREMELLCTQAVVVDTQLKYLPKLIKWYKVSFTVCKFLKIKNSINQLYQRIVILFYCLALPSLPCLKEIILFGNLNTSHNMKIQNISYLHNHKQRMELILEAMKNLKI